MCGHHTILAVLVALALALAPLGAGLGAGAGQAMAGMEDCDHGDKGGCPCCDAPAQCPPDLCLAKCFKLVAEIVQPALMFAARERLGDADCPLRPPDSRKPPDPPPPRS
jgi:hypothetical protein